MRMRIFIIGIFIFLSCFNPFAPRLGEIGTDSDLVLTEQRTPEELLQNFRYAYTFKDSIIYRDILDDTFVFIYRDYEEDKLESWDKETDIRTTIGLFNNFDIIKLIWNSTNYITYFDDSLSAELSKGFTLSLDADIRITGDALFVLKKDTKKNIWLIKRWIDKSRI